MFTYNDVLKIIKENNIIHGQSAYLYNLDFLSYKIDMVVNCFEKWNILYSMKANPHKEFLEIVREKGLGIDAASKNEVISARKIGFSKEKIFFSSPGKSFTDLKDCINECVIIADSLNEIKRLSQIVDKSDVELDIGIRVNLLNKKMDGNAFEIMSGIPTKFGIYEGELEEVFSYCDENKIRIVGIHIYFGSQILDESVILNNLNSIAEFTLNLSLKRPLKFVNFGGGFGVPYEKNNKPIVLDRIVHDYTLSNKINMLCKRGIACNLELGRYLCAEAGVYIASVEDIKFVNGKKYVVLSSGMNGFFRPIFTKEFHNIVTHEDGGLEKATIVGNLCTPIDQYIEDYIIEKLEIGDWVYFENAGAYGYSMSLLEFISHDKPLEIICSSRRD